MGIFRVFSFLCAVYMRMFGPVGIYLEPESHTTSTTDLTGKDLEKIITLSS